MLILPRKYLFGWLLSIFVLSSSAALSQTTQFSYQGHLENNGSPVTGAYDFQFQLWNGLAGGSQLGSTQFANGVQVTDGIFTVFLDFGFQFDGGNRWLQTHVRPSGGSMYIQLTPRKPIVAVPYAVRSLNSALAETATNASQLGGVSANQFVLTTDPRMTDARPPTAGSANYIQSGTALQTGNFRISGNGVVGGTIEANVVRAVGHYSIGPDRILATTGVANIFAGVGAGASNTTGVSNSFFGFEAGLSNSAGHFNSFFGTSAGKNTVGSSNSFFGRASGNQNTSGHANSFFGDSAGMQNTTGFENAFFGFQAGLSNNADRNSFFGGGAGIANTVGSDNAFFGSSAGQANTGGSLNSFYGSYAGFSSIGNGNSFFGGYSGYFNGGGGGNSFFGTSAGRSNITGSSNSFFGFEAGHSTTSDSNSFFGSMAGRVNTSGSRNSFFGWTAGDSNITGSQNTIIGDGADVGSGSLVNATALGSGAIVSQSNSLVLGSNANVGIGTSAPKAKLDVRGGSAFIAHPNSLIITSPNGACWFITVNNSGILGANLVTCPN